MHIHITLEYYMCKSKNVKTHPSSVVTEKQ